MLQAVRLVRGAAVEALLTGLPLPSCFATRVLRGLPPPVVLGAGAPEAGMQEGLVSVQGPCRLPGLTKWTQRQQYYGVVDFLISFSPLQSITVSISFPYLDAYCYDVLVFIFPR